MKAIETHYNGYRFRSRLEARWAVFFDTLGIEYQYEPEGFELKWVKRLGYKDWHVDFYHYLPDFYLPNVGQGCWVEIKGSIPTEEEIAKAGLLAYHSREHVNIFVGQVGSEEILALRHNAPPDELVAFIRQIDSTTSETQKRQIINPVTTLRWYWDFVTQGLSGDTKGVQRQNSFPWIGPQDRIICYCPACDNISLGRKITHDTRNELCPTCYGISTVPIDNPEVCYFEECWYCGTFEADGFVPSQPKLQAAYNTARSARFEFGEKG